MVFEKNKSIERSRGIRELLELPPSSRLIIFYLQKNKLSTLEKMSEELKMPLSTVQANAKDLLSKNLISTDGYTFRNRLRLENIPPNPQKVQFSEKADFGETPGKTLDFMVSVDFAKKVSELWNLSIIDIKPVYYPYWMLNHKGKNLMIDGVFNKLDNETAECTRKFL